MHDKYKKRFQTSRSPQDRLRQQIAAEAARRLYEVLVPAESEPGAAQGSDGPHLREASAAEFYAAKRQAVAVLGHRVRPADLPTDSEVRRQVLALVRTRGGPGPSEGPEPRPDESVEHIADHVDRFAIYRMRLLPLETVKLDPRRHPEGDALYHSLQVFERARDARPYDEEFLLAALLHDVGKAIDPGKDHSAAGLEALRGTLTERTAWLIEHHGLAQQYRDRTIPAKARRVLEDSEWLDDLLALREADVAGRVPGAVVGTVDEALDYLRGLDEDDVEDG